MEVTTTNNDHTLLNDTLNEHKRRKVNIVLLPVHYFDVLLIDEFIFKDENNEESFLEELKCSICISVCKDPVMLVDCQHGFCRTCIQSVVKNECPNCRKPFDKTKSIVPNRTVSSLISHLKVNCIHPTCSWIGACNKRRTHILKECPFLEQCQCGKLYDKQDSQSHLEECSFVKVQCVCGVMVEKKHIDTHKSQDCGEVVIKCPMVIYGCVWEGKRREYTDKEGHQELCKAGTLWAEYQKLLKALPCMESYKNSDCFLVTGLTDPNNERRTLIHKYRESFMELNFPVRMGSTDQDLIRISAITNDSLFSVVLKEKIENYVQLDIDEKQGIMAITMNGKHHRFFIIKQKDHKVRLEKKFGKIQVEFLVHNTRPCPAIMVYAHRRFIHWSDKTEYPFIIPPADRYFTKFTLQCSSPSNFATPQTSNVNKELTDKVFGLLSKFFSS